jgi:tRNA pseudouridine55 synthase
VKVGGERLYRKAHRGETFETPQREVEVMRAELLESGPASASYEIECSSGTYIRSLIETLEDAYCESLRRVRIGPFKVEDAGAELSPNEALGFLPEARLDADQARAVSHGQAIESSGAELPGAEPLSMRLTFEGELLAVARLEDEELKPEVVLA